MTFTSHFNVYSTTNQSFQSWRWSVRMSFLKYLDQLCNMCTRSEQWVLKRLERVCWWGNDHVIWSASRLSGWLWLLSSGSSGHLLYLHLNTDLRPAASLCILIALASFAVCHWLLSLISIPHAPPPPLSVSPSLSPPLSPHDISTQTFRCSQAAVNVVSVHYVVSSMCL